MISSTIREKSLMQVFPIRLFCWIAKERTFVGEMSELSHYHSGTVNRIFQILNPETNSRCTFTFSNIDRNEDGEITQWVYLSKHTDPKMNGLKVVIFND